jgi:hypothetical protein
LLQAADLVPAKMIGRTAIYLDMRGARILLPSTSQFKRDHPEEKLD